MILHRFFLSSIGFHGLTSPSFNKSALKWISLPFSKWEILNSAPKHDDRYSFHISLEWFWLLSSHLVETDPMRRASSTMACWTPSPRTYCLSASVLRCCLVIILNKAVHKLQILAAQLFLLQNLLKSYSIFWLLTQFLLRTTSTLNEHPHYVLQAVWFIVSVQTDLILPSILTYSHKINFQNIIFPHLVYYLPKFPQDQLPCTRSIVFLSHSTSGSIKGLVIHEQMHIYTHQ